MGEQFNRRGAPAATQAALVAIGDLHVEALENRRFVEELRPLHERDWLIACGDVAETMADIEWALATLARRFEKVVWVPGNHELWTCPADPVQLRGDARYRHLVRYCRGLGIATPEDPYPVWSGPGGPVVVAPLFTLYDYSFGRNVGPTKRASLARAYRDVKAGSFMHPLGANRAYEHLAHVALGEETPLH